MDGFGEIKVARIHDIHQIYHSISGLRPRIIVGAAHELSASVKEAQEIALLVFIWITFTRDSDEVPDVDVRLGVLPSVIDDGVIKNCFSEIRLQSSECGETERWFKIHRFSKFVLDLAKFRILASSFLPRCRETNKFIDIPTAFVAERKFAEAGERLRKLLESILGLKVVVGIDDGPCVVSSSGETDATNSVATTVVNVLHVRIIKHHLAILEHAVDVLGLQLARVGNGRVWKHGDVEKGRAILGIDTGPFACSRWKVVNFTLLVIWCKLVLAKLCFRAGVAPGFPNIHQSAQRKGNKSEGGCGFREHGLRC